jgi:hypothetical protein
VLVHISGISAPGGPWYEADGTSLAAPVIAGAFALAGAASTGSPTQLLYKRALGAPGLMHDVTAGADNAACGGRPICSARRGFDGPTGLGTPDGLRAFGGLDSRHPGVTPLVVGGAIRANRGWHVPLTLRNANPFAVKVLLTLRLPGRPTPGRSARSLTLASTRTITMAPGGQATVSPVIVGGYRTMIRRRHRVSVLASIDVHDAAGHEGTAALQLRLQAP